jgi:hypothetical protein
MITYRPEDTRPLGTKLQELLERVEDCTLFEFENAYRVEACEAGREWYLINEFKSMSKAWTACKRVDWRLWIMSIIYYDQIIASAQRLSLECPILDPEAWWRYDKLIENPFDATKPVQNGNNFDRVKLMSAYK